MSSENLTLEPCPFCGGTDVDVRETHNSPTMNGPGELISVEIRHSCERVPGMLSRTNVIFAGRDHASAIAAWNRRASLIDTSTAREAFDEVKEELRRRLREGDYCIDGEAEDEDLIAWVDRKMAALARGGRGDV